MSPSCGIHTFTTAVQLTLMQHTWLHNALLILLVLSWQEHTVTAACEDLIAAILKDIMDSSAANSSTSSDAAASSGYCVTEQEAVQRIDATAMAAMLQSGSKDVDTFVLLVRNGSSSCNGSSGTTNLSAAVTTGEDDWTLL
jgi:predicted class III extradiol MEMO1 family dioxygenase